MKSLLILILVIIGAFLLFSYRITQVPPGVNGDESGIGYNALLMSRNLTDENGNFLPLFVFAKGSDWKQPVSVYATVLVFRLFGANYFNLRATSVLFIVASLYLLYLTAKERGGTKFFLASTAVFLSAPITMIQSHLALENIAPLPFIFAWLWGFLKYEKTKKATYLLLAGACLGAGLFSYLGMRLAVPALASISVYFLRKNFRAVINFVVGFVPFATLLGIAYFRYPGAVFGNFNAPLPGLYDFLTRYLSIFDISFLFFKGDATAYHSTGYFGMLLLAALPLFVLGIVKIFQKRDRFELLLLAGFFLGPILFGLVPDVYRASRLLFLVPFFVIISAGGFLSLSKNLKAVFVFLIVTNYFFFAKDYWFDYPKRVRKIFPVAIEQTYEFRLKK